MSDLNLNFSSIMSLDDYLAVPSCLIQIWIWAHLVHSAANFEVQNFEILFRSEFGAASPLRSKYACSIFKSHSNLNQLGKSNFIYIPPLCLLLLRDPTDRIVPVSTLSCLVWSPVSVTTEFPGEPSGSLSILTPNAWWALREWPMM